MVKKGAFIQDLGKSQKAITKTGIYHFADTQSQGCKTWNELPPGKRQCYKPTTTEIASTL